MRCRYCLENTELLLAVACEVNVMCISENPCNQTAAILLGDFLVFLSRVASASGILQKMVTPTWTSLLLKVVGYNSKTGECNLMQ
jgi:hypothetical protein